MKKQSKRMFIEDDLLEKENMKYAEEWGMNNKEKELKNEVLLAKFNFNQGFQEGKAQSKKEELKFLKEIYKKYLNVYSKNPIWLYEIEERIKLLKDRK